MYWALILRFIFSFVSTHTLTRNHPHFLGGARSPAGTKGAGAQPHRRARQVSAHTYACRFCFCFCFLFVAVARINIVLKREFIRLLRRRVIRCDSLLRNVLTIAPCLLSLIALFPGSRTVCVCRAFSILATPSWTCTSGCRAV